MSKKISIIIPIYKSELWIERCIESVINQTYKNIEIILINDGSPDRSGEICEYYANKDCRIKLLNKKNEGTAKARNKGLEIATGEYIQFVDSDDFLEKNSCEVLLNYMEQESSDLVICGLNVRKNGELLRNPHLKYNKLNIKESYKSYIYIYPVFASPCNKLYKRNLIKKGFNENLSVGEDLNFNLDYIKNIKDILAIEECLYNVNLDNENSLNRSFREDRLDLFIEQNKMEFKLCNELYKDNYDKTFLYDKCMNGVHSHLRNVVSLKDRNESLVTIKKYIKNKYVINAAKNARTERLDYKVFNELFKIKSSLLVYCFFILKLKLVKAK